MVSSKISVKNLVWPSKIVSVKNHLAGLLQLEIENDNYTNDLGHSVG